MMNRIEDISGLTPAQEGMYIRYSLAPETKDYLQNYLFRVEEDTDLELFKCALTLLPLRHKVLKSAFAVAGGNIKQVLLTDRSMKIETVEINLPYTEITLNDFVMSEFSCPFDLQRDPLVRCVFLFFSDARFFIFRTHHILVDGWSMPILFRDLLRDYRFLINGGSTEALRQLIKVEKKAYPSFSSCVNVIRSKDPDPALKYWQRLLAGGHTCVLPKKRNIESKRRGICRVSTVLSRDLCEKTDSFASAQGISVNTLFETVFGLALQKHSGQNDVIFYKVISGRSIALPGIEGVVGPLMNTVPIRVCRDGTTPPILLLKQVGEQSVFAEKNGFISLSDSCRTAGINPNSIDIVFEFGNYDASAMEDTHPPISLLIEEEQTEFALTVNLSPCRDGYRLRMSFDDAVYSEGLILALKDSFISILSRLIEFDALRIKDNSSIRTLLSLTQKERQTILFKFNDTAVPYNKTESLYTLFEKQAKRTPDRDAILYQDQRISFFKLLQKVDTVADHLRAFDLSVGDVVAVYLNRTPFLILCQLAIIKIGGIFLPVDKRFPKDRLQVICSSCNVKLLIADTDISEIAVNRIATPDEFEKTVGSKQHVEPRYSTPCYIIYTSGSTGVPKGCVLTQPSLVNFCTNNNTLSVLRQKEHNVFACVNSAAFDYFIAETLLPLLNGYTVAFCNEEEGIRQELFLDVVQKNGINVLMTTPTKLALFYDNSRDCRSLRNISCLCSSGEPLHERLLERLYESSPHAKVFNPLGPSECTVWNLGGELDRSAGVDVHLGKPIANTQIYIVDTQMSPVSIGVTGELCIAGDGVGGGYYNQPKLTAEKFVNNPFGKGKLYKTGDLACWREDGNVVFVGRNDFQVKINGQRVELGEIEAALFAVDGIDNAAVILRKDKIDRQLICAFYTGTETRTEVLRSALEKKLPRYMLPQSFTYLKTLPLTTSGKTDRRALENMSVPELGEESVVQPPQNDTERAICDLFAAVLGQERIGRDASFYDLGGTSLLMIKLLSIAPLDSLSATDFLTAPTPAGLAEKLDKNFERKYTNIVPLYTPKVYQKAVVLIPYAGGDASAFIKLVDNARRSGRKIALYYADWDYFDNWKPIVDEIRELAIRHDVIFYSHCAGSAFALKLLDILNSEEQIVKGYFAAADIPSERSPSSFNGWNLMPDSAIVRVLKSVGLSTDGIGDAQLHEMISRFRKHTSYYDEYFSRKTGKTNVKTIIVINKNDPFTKAYKTAEKHWGNTVAEVQRVILIDTPSHYFQNSESDMLLSLFADDNQTD